MDPKFLVRLEGVFLSAPCVKKKVFGFIFIVLKKMNPASVNHREISFSKSFKQSYLVFVKRVVLNTLRGVT